MQLERETSYFAEEASSNIVTSWFVIYLRW
jgi:hypothetical protein